MSDISLAWVCQSRRPPKSLPSTVLFNFVCNSIHPHHSLYFSTIMIKADAYGLMRSCNVMGSCSVVYSSLYHISNSKYEVSGWTIQNFQCKNASLVKFSLYLKKAGLASRNIVLSCKKWSSTLYQLQLWHSLFFKKLPNRSPIWSNLNQRATGKLSTVACLNSWVYLIWYLRTRMQMIYFDFYV